MENLGEGHTRFHILFLQLFLNLELCQNKSLSLLLSFFFWTNVKGRNIEELNRIAESEKERIQEKPEGWINRVGDPQEAGLDGCDPKVSGFANRGMSLSGVGGGSAEHLDDAGEVINPGGACQRGLL